MTRIPLAEYGTSPFEKLIGHNQAVLDQWNALEGALFSKMSLDANLLEQVRRALAFSNECEYCMVKAGRPERNEREDRIQVAKAFAELFALDHKSINDAHFQLLKSVFTTDEISELCTFISFIDACQKLGRIYNLTEDYQQNKATTLAELAMTKR